MHDVKIVFYFTVKIEIFIILTLTLVFTLVVFDIFNNGTKHLDLNGRLSLFHGLNH